MRQEGIDWGSWVKAFLLPIIGFVAIFSVARADIGNLKERVSKLETLPESVTGMKSDLQNMKERVERMDGKIDQLISRPH